MTEMPSDREECYVGYEIMAGAYSWGYDVLPFLLYSAGAGEG